MDYGALFIVRKARKLPILSFSCEPPPFCSIQINHLNKLLKNVTFFFFLESFNLWCPLLMIVLYHQIKTPISFWYRQELNLRSLIQPSETLPVKVTETH